MIPVAGQALKKIALIYAEDNKLKDFSTEERLRERRRVILPDAEAYFAWARKMMSHVLDGSETFQGIQYSLNQEKYLRQFLNDGNIPLDN